MLPAAKVEVGNGCKREVVASVAPASTQSHCLSQCTVGVVRISPKCSSSNTVHRIEYIHIPGSGNRFKGHVIAAV